MQAPSFPRHLSQRRQDILALLLILGVASLMRFWQLERIPPGLFGDEAVNGLDALDALAGRARVFYPANFGREGLHMLLLAQSIRWLGPTALALRVPSALAGVLTALATYWLGRELFARTWLRGTLVPLLAALFLSTSYWHVHFSRFGIRGVFTPLLATLAFAAFWRGANRLATLAAAGGSAWRDGRCWVWFLAAGLFTGLGVHFYSASRLIPIFLGAFLLAQALYVWLLERRGRRAASTHPPVLSQALGPVLGLYAVAAAVFAPLGLYFLRTPGSLTQRASAVALTNPEISGGDPLGRLLQALVANVWQFVGPGAGDPARFYNLPGRPVFDAATALLALAGLALCLWALRRGSSPHLFLLLWFPALLTPTFLAVDRFPTLPRALGVIPGVYFFPALALGELLFWTRRRTRRSDENDELCSERIHAGSRHSHEGGNPASSRVDSHLRGNDKHRRINFLTPISPAAQPEAAEAATTSPISLRRAAPWLAAGVVTLALLLHGGLTWRDYFQRWANDAATFDAFEGDMAAAAAWVAGHPDQRVMLSADIYRHPTWTYLHQHAPLSEIFTYADPQVSFFDGRSALPLAGDAATTYLFTANAGPDPLLAQMAGWAGFAPASDGEAGEWPGLAIYTLPAGALERSQFQAADVAFERGLRLIGYRIEALADDQSALLLLWQVGGPQPGWYQGVQVQAGWQPAGGGPQLAQVSSELAYRPTEWTAGDQVLSWLILPTPPDLPPDVQVALRAVDQATGLPLAAGNSDGEGWLYLPLP